MFHSSNKIINGVSIHVPTIGELARLEDGFDKYMSLMQTFVTTPTDLTAELWCTGCPDALLQRCIKHPEGWNFLYAYDGGIDYTSVTDFDLFVQLFAAYYQQSLDVFTLIFPDMDANKRLFSADVFYSVREYVIEVTGFTLSTPLTKFVSDNAKVEIIKAALRTHLARLRNKNFRNKSMAEQVKGLIFFLIGCSDVSLSDIYEMTLNDITTLYSYSVHSRYTDAALTGVYGGTVNKDAKIDYLLP
jgi:hypothetical protein